jgi:hypothetical protein
MATRFFTYEYPAAVASQMPAGLTFTSAVGPAVRSFRGVPGPESGTVSVTMTVNGVAPTKGRAILLLEGDGAVMAVNSTDVAGNYEFTGLAPGNYAVVLLDATGAWRGKVAHTVVA